MENDILNEELNDTSTFTPTDDERFAEKAIIKVIGVGGGGGNAVNYMYKQQIPLVRYVVLNTDKQALGTMEVPEKIILGYDITQGQGAGNNPEIGKQCAEASVDDIKKLFDNDTEMVFITAGMGGGTGTGAAPIVARLAKEAGMLTIGIVTVPFQFESEQKILTALEGAKEMQKYVDALLVINNENLTTLYPDLSLFNCFEKADDTLANAARSISEIISEKCFINVDFQDVKTTLKDSGTAIISSGEGEGENRVTKAIENALKSPLLKAHDIKTSKRLLMKFSCARECKKPITAKELNEITVFTSSLPKTVKVKWGIADIPEMGERIKVTILASGFDVTLRDGEGKGDGPITFSSENNTPKSNKPEKPDPDNEAAIETTYGTGTIKQMALNRLKVRCFIFKPEEMVDDEVIAAIERTPTSERDTRANELVHKLHNAPEPAMPQQQAGGESGGAIMF